MSTKLLLLVPLLAVCTGSLAQDTFSLVAIDRATQTVVSAGASCVDGDVLAGGAAVISSVHPGLGVIHTQSFYDAKNQTLGDSLLRSGLSAKQILDSLVAYDIGRSPTFRQYLAVTVEPNDTPTAFTGADCFPWAGQWQGTDVAIAGNILQDSLVIVKMCEAFKTAKQRGAPLEDCAMAALLAVAYPGADRRCMSAGLSSRSAFIRMAKPNDHPDSLTLDLVVAYPEGGQDPIELLNQAYLAWRESSKR